MEGDENKNQYDLTSKMITEGFNEMCECFKCTSSLTDVLHTRFLETLSIKCHAVNVRELQAI